MVNGRLGTRTAPEKPDTCGKLVMKVFLILSVLSAIFLGAVSASSHSMDEDLNMDDDDFDPAMLDELFKNMPKDGGSFEDLKSLFESLSKKKKFESSDEDL